MAVEQETDIEEQTRYSIEREWFEREGLSFDDMVIERMCDSCRGRLNETVEERRTVMEKGRPTFRVVQARYGDNPLKVIREDCGRKKGFITPDMPTLEAVFRVYLANGNQPMPLEHVREQLAEWCPGGGCQWMMLPSETLERLVRSDRYYGLRAVELPT